ncbi:MAG: hypothetical protein Ct9H300mP14_13410 [Gammaproteobacteria bacterium]|nr:MAG: hypothetical protein Ct9H300mP14_13410 [Gammaproteobacteria bacterium]
MEKERIKEFAGKVMSDLSGGMAAGLAYVGAQTGLFKTLSGQGQCRWSTSLKKNGLQPRYVEEWLKGMVWPNISNMTWVMKRLNADELGFFSGL